jgi:hypothetical protein
MDQTLKHHHQASVIFGIVNGNNGAWRKPVLLSSARPMVEPRQDSLAALPFGGPKEHTPRRWISVRYGGGITSSIPIPLLIVVVAVRVNGNCITQLCGHAPLKTEARTKQSGIAAPVPSSTPAPDLPASHSSPDRSHQARETRDHQPSHRKGLAVAGASRTRQGVVLEVQDPIRRKQVGWLPSGRPRVRLVWAGWWPGLVDAEFSHLVSDLFVLQARPAPDVASAPGRPLSREPTLHLTCTTCSRLGFLLSATSILPVMTSENGDICDGNNLTCHSNRSLPERRG